MKFGFIATIAAAVALLILCVPTSAGVAQANALTAGIVFNGVDASGYNHATLLVRNISGQPSNNFRINFPQSFNLKMHEGLDLKPYDVINYSQPIVVAAGKILSYNLVEKSPAPQNCFAGEVGDLITGSSVISGFCGKNGQAFPLAMFVIFPANGNSPNLTVIVHNYGRTVSAPFYLWLVSQGWTHQFPGIKSGGEVQLAVQEVPSIKEYTVVLALEALPSPQPPYLTDKVSQGIG